MTTHLPGESSALLDHLPDWWCFRDWHSLENSIVRIAGTIISKQAIAGDKISCKADGASVKFRLTTPSEHSRKTFWFLPESHLRGIEIEYSVTSGTHESLIEIETSSPGRLSRFPFMQIHDWSTRQPVPPRSNIERVSGAGATEYNYFCNGATDFLRFARASAANHVDPFASRTRILDWGAGCGRLTRWFAERSKGEVVGVDIDLENLAWCKDNIKGASFKAVGLYPPTDLKTKSFDMVLANSVLSHLTQSALVSWLAEIKRILRPNGVALLSYHGDFSAAYFLSHWTDAIRRIESDGYFDEMVGKEMIGVLSDPTYYRQTFMSDRHAFKLFDEAGFHVRDTLVGHVSRCQNLAVLRHK